jgi:hypothetical protein
MARALLFMTVMDETDVVETSGWELWDGKGFDGKDSKNRIVDTSVSSIQC